MIDAAARTLLLAEALTRLGRLTGPALLDAVRADQADRWRAGEPVLAEVYLDGLPDLTANPEDALVLLCGELLLRGERGEVPALAEYQTRFPHLAERLELLFLVEKAFGTSAHISSPEPTTGGVPAPPVPAPEAPPGYEILTELGQGGMGVVYKARHRALNRVVALKMLRAGPLARPEQLARFRAEADAVARLQHPNVVQIFEVGEQDGRPFLALEFVDGPTLARKCGRTPQPAREAARLVETLARAVHEAHRQGIIHRDLKPANVLLTTEGVPKVADFGLAKQLEGGADLTESGAFLGTPSYMAPEQAEGRAREVGPAADVYALGTILYELLTGRPPFEGETPLETMRWVVTDEPVPPRRLQRGTPRDLETVCLKCLHKEPARRYPTAEALADDLRRYREGRPVVARPVGRLGRAWQWCRRQPREAALVAGAVLLALLGGGGGLTWAWQRAELVRASDADLDRVRGHLLRWDLREAEAALLRAEGRVAHGGPDALRGRVQRMREHWDLMLRLEQIRLARATWADDRLDDRTADRDYQTVFEECGLGKEADDPKEVAGRIQTSPIRAQLVAALDDWAIATTSGPRRDRVLEVARRADPGEWSDRFRDPTVWSRPDDLERLAREAPVEELTPQLLSALGAVLSRRQRDPVPLLRAAQQRHPADFWIALRLSDALLETNPEEAAGFLRVALAVRPATSAVYNNLGFALRRQGKVGEAIAQFRRAIEIDPRAVKAHYNLGNASRSLEKPDDAIRHFRQALEIDPRYAAAHYNLGTVLHERGKLEDAIRHFRQALEINPRDAAAHTNLGAALRAQGKLDDAIQHHRRAIELDPRDPKAHYNLGKALDDQGKADDAIRHYTKAVALAPTLAEAHCNLGLLLQRQGRFAEALRLLRRGHELGFGRPGWNYPSAGWVRECQRLLELQGRLPDLLAGRISPGSEAECLEYATCCALARQSVAAAGLYARALAADPGLAADPRAGHRYNAACTAALAAAGRGRDAAGLKEKDRAAWRDRALGWLHEDLAAWTALFDKDPARNRRLVRETLRDWRQDADLAGLRDEDALARLPEAERRASRKLWADVDALLRRTLLEPGKP